MVHEQYDAFELENAVNTASIKPMRRFGWFITNSAFSAYDTLACVGNLIKACKEGDMLTEEEILALQQKNSSDMNAVSEPSRKYKKTQRKMHK